MKSKKGEKYIDNIYDEDVEVLSEMVLADTIIAKLPPIDKKR